MRLNEVETNPKEIEEHLKRFFIYGGIHSIVDGVVNINGILEVGKQVEVLPIQFGKVSGDFVCGESQRSLAGCPKEVGGSFFCSSHFLKSLEGGPQIVKSDFTVTRTLITSLKGGPIHVSGYYDCYNNQLTSIEGSPTHLGRFRCDTNYLKSLKGGPEHVVDYVCHNNELESLDGLPKIIVNEISLTYNKDLPMLNLLLVARLRKIRFRPMIEDHELDVLNILNKNLGKGRKGVILCAAELTRAGFQGNARR